MYFSMHHLKADFHVDYEIVIFLIEMHRLTSERVIRLGKPGCPVGKCNPLSSFHLWRELALSFLMSTL